MVDCRGILAVGWMLLKFSRNTRFGLFLHNKAVSHLGFDFRKNPGNQIMTVGIGKKVLAPFFLIWWSSCETVVAIVSTELTDGHCEQWEA